MKHPALGVVLVFTWIGDVGQVCVLDAELLRHDFDTRVVDCDESWLRHWLSIAPIQLFSNWPCSRRISQILNTPRTLPTQKTLLLATFNPELFLSMSSSEILVYVVTPPRLDPRAAPMTHTSVTCFFETRYNRSGEKRSAVLMGP